MTRYRDREIHIPVVVGIGVGSGVAPIFAALAVFAVLVVLIAIGVSCADFGEGSTIPEGPGCYPFACTTVMPTPEPQR